MHPDQLDEPRKPFILFEHNAHLRWGCCALRRISSKFSKHVERGCYVDEIKLSSVFIHS